ncbi:MAG: transcriptional regulator, GntR family [Rhizobium sp.]|nr:transcriptional regulator, GntR family [Rhizobium sp.]
MDDQLPNLDILPRRTLARANGPLYRQLADVLREPILSEAFAVGDELPKEADIAERFGVSLITVRQALRDLEADGLIRKRSAKPAVVAARNQQMNFTWNFQNFADMALFTKGGKLHIKSYRRQSSPIMQRVFGLSKEEQGFCLSAVLEVGGQHKSQITTYFPPEIGKRLHRSDFGDVLIFQSVQKTLGLRLAVAHVTVRAEIADADIATDLGCAMGSAILTTEMLYQSADQQKIEFTIARHPAERFSISYDAPNDL